jgi:uncharacterized protein YbaP (TraB family)
MECGIMKMRKYSGPLFVLLFFLSFAPLLAVTDPKVAEFLQGMDKYYYSLSHEGLTSLQADVNCDVSVDGTPAQAEASAFKFHFSYLGKGTFPVIAPVQSPGDTAFYANKQAKISDISLKFMRLWGLFTTQPIFDTDAYSYVYTRNQDQSFQVTGRGADGAYTLWFDPKGVAQKVEFDAEKVSVIMKLSFIPTAKGPLLGQLSFDEVNDKESDTVRCVFEYGLLQGLQVPTQMTISTEGGKSQVKFHYVFTNYVFHMANTGKKLPPGQDYQVLPAESEVPGAKHFLWRVRSSTATVYLLGSIHIRPESPLLIPDSMDRCYRSANFVGFEYDISQDEKNQAEQEAYMKKNFVYPPSDNLLKHLEPREWNIIQSILLMDGLQVDQAVRMKPLLLGMVLEDLALQKEGLDHGMGIDQIFYRRAQADKKPVFGMEFWWKPLEELSSLSDQDQVYDLIGSVLSEHNALKFLNEALRLWKTGDTAGLETLMNRDISPPEKRENDKIIVDRNQKWVPQFERMLGTQAVYFVVVGSGHLVGASGVPSLLRAKGYQVDQL